MCPSARDRPETIDIDSDVLWALAKEPNRRVLRYFDETDRDRVTLDELAEYVTAHGTGRFGHTGRKAEIHLHHSSLPELDDLGIIDYEMDSGVVWKPNRITLPPDFKSDVLALDDDD